MCWGCLESVEIERSVRIINSEMIANWIAVCFAFQVVPKMNIVAFNIIVDIKT